MNPAESLPRLHLVALEKVSAPGALLTPFEEPAGNHESGSGRGAGTGAVLLFPNRYGFSVKVPEIGGAA